MTKLRVLTRDWVGLTAIVVGNGPSMLDPERAQAVAERQYQTGAKVLVSNGGYKILPFADSLMCSDRHWLAANPDLSGFKGPEVIVTRPEAVARLDRRMSFVRSTFIGRIRDGEDIFANPGVLVEGHNSTSTNISLAVLRGVARFIIVGVDLAPGPGLRRRTYDESTDDPVMASIRYQKQVDHLTWQSEAVLARGVKVINASPRSRLKCYPYANFGDIE